MELLHLSIKNKSLRLEGSMAGWQALFWDNQLVSQFDASPEQEQTRSHRFEIQDGETISVIEVNSHIQWQPFIFEYTIKENDQILETGQRDEKDIEQQTPVIAPDVKPKFSVIGLVSLGFKLFKSAKVIKVLLAGASLAAYSWLFSWQFALSLIACLVFHEYGHIRAMKYFGMKTKGIYLIPFVGGLAVTDEKINTRWQDVVISIMGPTFGLVMSIISLFMYWLTGNIFFAGLATFNALLNLFNLLPILPLDGGHILKSISFSMNTKLGLVACIIGALFGVFISYTFGLALLGFLLLIGSIEILLEWKFRHDTHLLPLNGYAQLVSTVWYFSTVAMLIGIIMYFANIGDEMLALPMIILGS